MALALELNTEDDAGTVAPRLLAGGPSATFWPGQFGEKQARTIALTHSGSR